MISIKKAADKAAKVKLEQMKPIKNTPDFKLSISISCMRSITEAAT